MLGNFLLYTPKLSAYYPTNIVFSFFDDRTYTSPPTIYLTIDGVAQHLLTDIIILVNNIKDDSITLGVEIDGIKELLQCDLEGNYTSKENKIYVRDGRSRMTLCDYFNLYPLQFKTTDDRLIVANEILDGNPNAIVFSDDNIVSIDWEKYGTNIRKECSDKSSKTISIQDTVKTILEADSDYKYLIFDHGTGEMADFIAIRETDTMIQISMFHVKAMKAANFNSDVNDIYEVLQQAIKSSIWLKTKSVLLQKILSRRKSGKCIFIRGKLNELKQALRSDKRLVAEMYVVQPSISRNVALPDKYQEVLAAAKFYTLNSGRINTFKIWGS